MKCGIVIAVVLCALFARSYAGYKEEQPIPKPYVFSYTAGRMPGHVDRVHSEAGDGFGTIRGSFSYVDPRQQIRTVEYVADRNGFQPLLITNPNQDTTAVQNAKARHHVLFNNIVAEHQRVAEERGQTGEYNEEEYNQESYVDPVLISHPQDTPAVERAKLKHFDLYNKIALEHAKIAAERGQLGEEDEYESAQSQEKVIKIGY